MTISSKKGLVTARILSIVYLSMRILCYFCYTVLYSYSFAELISFILIWVVFGELPSFLFLIHLFTYKSKSKRHVLLSISMFLGAVIGLLSLADSIRFLFNGIQTFTLILTIGINIFLGVDALNNFKCIKASRVLIGIKLGYTILASLYNIVSCAQFGGAYLVYSCVSNIVGIIGVICYAVYFFSVVRKKETAESIQDELMNLKQRYEAGIISNDEYNRSRAQVLSKLDF